MSADHQFQWHNYKRPTFCAHCGNLLVGVMKQGLRCKRCDVDVHHKCQEDFKKECVDVVQGQHNFRDKTYKQPTYCDVCDKLLVGLVNQGIKCTECGTNIHEKCKEQVSSSCARSSKKTQPRQKKRMGSSRKKPTTKPSEKPNESAITIEQPTDAFAKMPATADGKEAIPMQEKKNGDLQNLDNMVDDVMNVMKQNADNLSKRQDSLENLQENADYLQEKSWLFKKKSEELKRKYWFQNKKFMIIIIVVVLLVLAIIGTVIALKVTGSKN